MDRVTNWETRRNGEDISHEEPDECNRLSLDVPASSSSSSSEGRTHVSVSRHKSPCKSGKIPPGEKEKKKETKLRSKAGCEARRRRKKEGEKRGKEGSHRGPISSPFYRGCGACRSTYLLPRSPLGALIHRRTLAPWILPTGPLALRTLRLDSVLDRKVNRSAPLNRIRRSRRRASRRVSTPGPIFVKSASRPCLKRAAFGSSPPR